MALWVNTQYLLQAPHLASLWTRDGGTIVSAPVLSRQNCSNPALLGGNFCGEISDWLQHPSGGIKQPVMRKLTAEACAVTMVR